MELKSFLSRLLCLSLAYLSCNISILACRVGSEVLKVYTKKSVEKILDVKRLESVYWDSEPLNFKPLSKATGINITLAETKFNFEVPSRNKKSKSDSNALEKSKQSKLIQDIFVTCSSDRDRSYTLTINLELDNPFKAIDFRFNQHKLESERELEGGAEKESELWEEQSGVFRIYMPGSTFLVQLNQRIRYDECLDVKYVQLGPNVNYDVECLKCSEEQKSHLDRIFGKKMSQFDAELDTLLSEKLLLGLQVLLNQKRLDLDLFME